MINKFKKIQRDFIQKLAQIFSNVLIKKLETEIGTEEFYATFEQAAKLNAYCIVLHDIYLD